MACITVGRFASASRERLAAIMYGLCACSCWCGWVSRGTLGCPFGALCAEIRGFLNFLKLTVHSGMPLPQIQSEETYWLRSVSLGRFTTDDLVHFRQRRQIHYKNHDNKKKAPCCATKAGCAGVYSAQSRRSSPGSQPPVSLEGASLAIFF